MNQIHRGRHLRSSAPVSRKPCPTAPLLWLRLADARQDKSSETDKTDTPPPPYHLREGTSRAAAKRWACHWTWRTPPPALACQCDICDFRGVWVQRNRHIRLPPDSQPTCPERCRIRPFRARTRRAAAFAAFRLQWDRPPRACHREH